MTFIQLCESHNIKATDHGLTMTAPIIDEETGEVSQESFLARRIELEMEVEGRGTLLQRAEIDAKLLEIMRKDGVDEDEFICNELMAYIDAMKMEAAGE